MMGVPSMPCFKLDQTFFGLEPKDRIALHSNLWDLVWAGDGRWDWDTIYALPIHLRGFFITKLQKLQDEKKKANEVMKEKSMNPPKKKIAKLGI